MLQPLLDHPRLAFKLSQLFSYSQTFYNEQRFFVLRETSQEPIMSSQQNSLASPGQVDILFQSSFLSIKLNAHWVKRYLRTFTAAASFLSLAG